MDNLKKKRSSLKGKITRISNILKPKLGTGEIGLEELDIYTLQIDGIWVELNDVHTEIIVACESDAESTSHISEFDDLASNVDTLRINIARERSKLKTEFSTVSNSATNGGVKTKVTESCLNLPKFELPNFYGEFNNWMSFKELFLTSIDKNGDLSKLQKFQYLIASLKGPALKLVSGFSLTEENYEHAWQTLVSRFDNKRELAFAQISKLFSFKAAKSNSAKSIFDILDTCNEVIRILSTLKIEVNSMVDIILIHVILGKVDDTLRQRWELSLTNQDIPTFSDLAKFLEHQAKSMSNKENGQLENKPKVDPKKALVNNVLVNKAENVCCVCSENHPIFKCPVFNQMSVDDRWKVVKSKRICVNCLRKFHFANKCQSNSTCKACHRKHHTTLHRFYPNADGSNVTETVYYSNSNSGIANSENVPTVKEDIQLSTTCCLNYNNDDTNTLLSTALIWVKNNEGHFITCRALIDNGSQKCLITRNCSKFLKLNEIVSNKAISAVNETLIGTTLSEVHLEFTSHFDERKKYDCSALVVNKITSDLPNFKFHSYDWPHLQGLKLADPAFFISSPIDILIGADIYAELLQGQLVAGERGTPVAISSHLGWLVSGRIFSNSKQNKVVVNCHITASIENQLKSFWELESVPQTELRTKDDVECESFYDSTVTRVSDRYKVRLPFKTSNKFANTASQALKRFHYLEAKLNKNSSLGEQYSTFMSEYLNLGHMEVVPPDQIEKEKSFYLPHHFVIKEDSSTTKLRVVFDASAKDSNGKSLNSTLHLGPRLQPELFSTLLKFRYFRVAISGDIEKMFRQIRISEEDSDFQRIFWRFNPDDDIQVYRLLTVTYGTACAPYLAVRTLQQLAVDEKVSFPQAAKAVMEDFYVDDLLSGSDSSAGAKQLVSDLSALLARGGFNLRKWASNCPEVLNDIPDHALAYRDISIEDDQSQKILGLFWNFKQDTFQIKISQPDEVLSKRNLLSVIARIYDPLGFLSPTTIILKIMLQDLWRNKLSWDDPIPEEVATTWKTFHSEMKQLSEIKIKRRLMPSDTPCETIQLHGFCDASTKAYSAVVYVRAVHENQVTVNIVAAKTRVAPLKATSLPRLELCAAHLLSKLFHAISKSMKKFWDQVFLWSDSEIVLCWIRSDSLKDQFVRNRVAVITSLTDSAIWNHVPGRSNPADSASRGILPKKLMDSELWWEGPSWLSDPNSSFIHDTKQHSVQETVTPDTLMHVSSVEVAPNREFLLKYSSFSKLIRVVAWCKRFIFNSRNSEKRLKGNLQVCELDKSLVTIVKEIQKVEFHPEIKSLETKGCVQGNSKIISLSPFLDSDKVLRVGGRLKNSNLQLPAKHPILLPKGHHLVNLIIQCYHKLSLHSGTSVVLSLIRQKFWFPAGRNTVRKVLRGCITCLKVNANGSNQLMANLPRERVIPSRPFQRVGLDFAGPVSTKPNLARSKITLKSYIALFICFSTKAVHLELVSDLSTEAFLASFRRFISRRGLPTDVYSDNATNFKGAKNYLNSLHKIVRDNTIQDFSSNLQISWHFIPPATPHHGGLWESNIKSTKRHLMKVCGSAVLNFEELATLLCQIEACLNSRPLCSLTSDLNDLEALSPGHFLIGAPLLAFPEKDPSPSICLKSRWSLLQRLRAQFWAKWSRDYLQSLQAKSKWYASNSNLHVGELVLLKRDNVPPPLKWTLARILEVFPGDDGIVRVVKLKTAYGEFTRPVCKLCPLEKN